MSNYVTKDVLDKSLQKHTDEIIDVVRDFMTQVSNQFYEVNTRLDELDRKYDRLLNTIDGFISRIDKYETEQAARDYQFEKLLTWARKVSEKTGIPLENL